MRPFFKIWISMHEPLSRKYVSYIGYIIANSRNVRKRIKKYYGRDAAVVYPAIDFPKYRFEKCGDFWLSVNRLYPEKRIELQVKAFRQMPYEKLLIVGGFSKGDHASKYTSSILKDMPPNVRLSGSIPEDELIRLYATCKGHITTAMDEDFGMTPLEAMASGKATVAVKEGGYLETVIDSRTGILVDVDPLSIIDAVKSISQHPEKYKNDCINRAKEFDIPIFIKKITDIIRSIQEKKERQIKQKD